MIEEAISETLEDPNPYCALLKLCGSEERGVR
jgi:hypothetical protein